MASGGPHAHIPSISVQGHCYVNGFFRLSLVIAMGIFQFFAPDLDLTSFSCSGRFAASTDCGQIVKVLQYKVRRKPAEQFFETT